MITDIFNGGGSVLRQVTDYQDTILPLGSTPLCRVMGRYGSDKGDGWHNYTPLYHWLLHNRRDVVNFVFECGVGSVNPDIPYSMAARAPRYRPGASLRAWAEYFPRAEIVGADCDEDVVACTHGPRVHAVFVDQRSAVSIRRMWRLVQINLGMIPGAAFDLMVDDGVHEFSANCELLMESWPNLAPRGLYVVEDIKDHEAHLWRAALRALPLRGVMVEMDGAQTDQGDNRLLVLERMS